MLGVLRVRDFRLLLGGQLLSNTGDWLLLVAAPYFVFRLTGSAMATGLTLTAESVPSIVLGPVAGVFVDRWDRRRTMIATDLLRGAAVLSMLAVHQRGEVWIVLVALTAEAGFSQFYNPARRAIIPNLVGRGAELSAANSLSQLVGGVIRLVGGPLGGVLYVLLGFRFVIALDVAGYVASAVLTALVRYRGEPETTPGSTAASGSASPPLPGSAEAEQPVAVRSRFLPELRVGLDHVRRTADLKILFGVAVLFFTGNAMLTALLVAYLGGVLHAGAQGLGVLFGTLGLGYVLGGPASRLVADRASDRAVIAASLAMLAGVFAASFNIPRLDWDVALFTLIGPPAVCFLVTADTSIARRTPNRMQGRVGSVYLAVQGTATLLGMISGSVLSQRIGIVPTTNVAAVLVAASALAALTLPSASREHQTQTPQPPGTPVSPTVAAISDGGDLDAPETATPRT